MEMRLIEFLEALAIIDQEADKIIKQCQEEEAKEQFGNDRRITMKDNGPDIEPEWIEKPNHYETASGEDQFEIWYRTYEWDQFVTAMETHVDKYVKRHRRKNGVQDLEKAIYTLTRLKEYTEMRANNGAEIQSMG